MVPTEDQIKQWVVGAPEPQIESVARIVTRAFANDGINMTGSRWERFIEYLKKNSTTFKAYVQSHEHGIEATSLLVLVIIEVCRKQTLTAEEAQLVTVAALHAILEVEKSKS